MGTANEGSREIITLEMHRRLPEYKADGKLQATRIGKYGMLSGDEDDCREPLLFENDDPAEAGWSSNCMIDRCYYMPDPQTDGRYRISFGARADIKEACSSLEIRLLVYEEKAGAFRELRTEQGTDTSHLSCDMEWEFTGSEEELAEYIPYAEFSWTDQTGTHNACQVSRFQYQIDVKVLGA